MGYYAQVLIAHRDIQSQGSPDPMVFRIKGRVIGPTFHFDCDELDFAKCSYGFATSRSLRLYNTSSIPMTYELQLMSSSGAPAFDDEFGLVQAAGTLSPGENHNVTVEFRPRHIKKYALEMSVAIDGVGSDLFSLPIRAESVVPMV